MLILKGQRGALALTRFAEGIATYTSILNSFVLLPLALTRFAEGIATHLQDRGVGIYNLFLALTRFAEGIATFHF